MAHDIELYNLARETYATCGSLTHTHAHLEQLGYEISSSTVNRWYKKAQTDKQKGQSKHDWDDDHRLYIETRATVTVMARDIKEKLFVEWLQDRAKLRQRIDDKLEEGVIDSQALYTLNQLDKKILKVAERLENRENIKEKLKLFFQRIFQNPILGPIFKENRAVIIREFKKELELLEKNA